MESEDFRRVLSSRYVADTLSTEMKKLKSGYLLKSILDRFTNKTLSILSPNRSLWMNFAHESVIVHMLQSLGIFNVKSYTSRFS